VLGPEGSLSAYFDLDVIYNEALHKVIGYVASIGSKVLAIGTFVAKH